MKRNMKEISIEKVTVNMGAGETGEKVEKCYKLLSLLTGRKPVRTNAREDSKTFGIRPGLEIGAKVTLRGHEAVDFLKRVFESKNNAIKKRAFDHSGNLSIGVHEYLNMPGIKYDHEIGIMGFDVAVTLKRPGFSIKYTNKNKNKKRTIGKTHRITKDEAISYIKETFKVEIV